ncbi:MAG: EFR1 family ferrodoxin [Clostridiales bacterium]|nr:EFR1 family ferrodoxin [Clostridiales bacterium]
MILKKLCFCFFSGTGMTKYIVERLIKEFEKHGASVDCFKIEDAGVRNINFSEYDMLGIAYPVHSFNAPKIVIDFAKQLPGSNGMSTFITYTAGEEHAVNYAASDLLIRKISKKGYKVFYDKLIEMPSNFAVKYRDEKVKSILNKANECIPQIAEDIMNLNPCSMKKKLGAKILTVLGRAEWPGARFAGKFFYAGKNCVRCGKCVSNCPNKNIVMNEPRPFRTGEAGGPGQDQLQKQAAGPGRNKKPIGFKWRCGLCMRCVYICPQKAISVRRPLRFIRFDKWYDPELFK